MSITDIKNELYQEELNLDFTILVLQKMKLKIIDINNSDVKLMDQIISATGGYDKDQLPQYKYAYLYLMQHNLFFDDSLNNNTVLDKLISELENKISVLSKEYNELKFAK